MVQPARHASDLFQLLVQPDGIALQRGHVGVAVERMKPTRRVPCRSAGQFRPLQQHHVGPTQLGQVIEHRTTDDAAPDDGNLTGGFHSVPPYDVGKKLSSRWGYYSSVSDNKCRMSSIAPALELHSLLAQPKRVDTCNRGQTNRQPAPRSARHRPVVIRPRRPLFHFIARLQQSRCDQTGPSRPAPCLGRTLR